jgi:hypothetical protein
MSFSADLSLMDSETSDNTETLSADLIASVFTAIEIPKSFCISRLEYSIFHFYSNITPGTNQLGLISFLVDVVIKIQVFAIITGEILEQRVQSPSPLSSVFQFLQFILSFSFDRYSRMPSTLTYTIVFTLSILSIIAQIYGFYSALHGQHFSGKKRTIIALLVVDLPDFLCFSVTFLASRSIGKLLAAPIAWDVFTAVFAAICSGFLAAMKHLRLSILHMSFFFRKGSGISYWRPLSPDFLFIGLLTLMNLTSQVLDMKTFLVLHSFVLTLSGFYQCFVGWIQNDLSEWSNAYKSANGILMVVVAVFGLISAFSSPIYDDTSIYILAWVFLVFLFVLRVHFHCHNKRIIEKLRTGEISFRRPLDSFQIVHYAKLAMIEALDCATSLEFVAPALTLEQPVWVRFAILHFACLVDCEDADAKKLLNSVVASAESSMSDRFILYEFDALEKAVIVWEIPEPLRNVLSRLEVRIGQYQTVSKTFTTKISDNMTVNYLLVDAIRSMRQLLKSTVKTLLQSLRNSPPVLAQYAIFRARVCTKVASAVKWGGTADRVANGSILYADYSHLNALDFAPKLRAKLLNKAMETSDRQSVRQYSQTSLAVSFANESSNQGSGRSLSLVLAMRAKARRFWTMITFVLVLLAFLVHWFVTENAVMGISTRALGVMNFLDDMLNLTIHFSRFAGSALGLVTKELPTVGEADVGLAFNSSLLFQYHVENTFARFRNGTIEEARVKKTLERLRANQKRVSIPVIGGQNYSQEVLFSQYLTWLPGLVSVFVPSPVVYEAESPEAMTLLTSMHSVMDDWFGFLGDVNDSLIFYAKSLQSTVTHYAVIPVGVLFVVMVILAALLAREVSFAFLLFPQETSRKTQTMLGTFLSSEFMTLPGLTLIWFALLAGCIAIELVLVWTSKYLAEWACSELRGQSNLVMNDILQVAFICSSIVNFHLALPTVPASISQSDRRYTGLVAAYHFYVNQTPGNRSVDIHQVTPTTFSLTDLIGQKICSGQFINVTETDVVNFVSYVDPQVYDDIQGLVQKLCDTVETVFSPKYVVIASNVLLLFLIAFCICWFASLVTCLRIYSNFLTLIDLIQLLPETHFSTSEQFSMTIRRKDRIAQVCDVGRPSILDLTSKPCALVDRTQAIVAVSGPWLTLFEQAAKGMIGQNALRVLHGDHESEHIELNEGMSLIVIQNMKAERDAHKRLKEQREKLRALRSTIIPERFLNEYELSEMTNSIEVGFLVNVTIEIVPWADNFDPSGWVDKEIPQVENWIMERCRVCQDCDFLRNSSRDFMLLFGVSGLYHPDLLLEIALTITFDIMRWTIESTKGRHKVFELRMLVTSGEGTVFCLDPDQKRVMEVWGPVFDKQALLRERNDTPNSVLICLETHRILEELRIGLAWESLDEDVFRMTFQGEQQNQGDTTTEGSMDM